MGRRLGVVAMVTAALVLGGCGDDDESAEETTAENPAADLDRYCQLNKELGQAGDEFFAELEQRDASRKEFEEGERDFLEQNEQEIDEVLEVAPSEIQGDAETFVEGLRVRAGVSDADVNLQEVGPAEERLAEFEQENCPS